MKKTMLMTAALLVLTACGAPQKTSFLDTNKARWDVIAAAEQPAQVQNTFLIMMR